MLSRRILALVALSLAPAFAIQGYNEYALREAREKAVSALAMRTARAAVDDLAQFAEGGRHILSILSDETSIQAGDTGACSAFLSKAASRVAGTTIIARTAADGTVLCSSLGADKTGYSVADRAYFRKAAESGAFVMGEYLLGRGTNKPTLQLVLPLRRADGGNDGVIYMGFDPERVGARLLQTGLPAHATLTLSDRQGIVLVRIPDQAEWAGKPLDERYRREIEATAGHVAEIRGPRGTLRVTGVLKPRGALEGITLAVGLNREAAFADIDAASRRGMVLILLGALLAVGSALIANRLLVQRPVGRLLDSVHAWRRGDLAARSNLRGETELGQLGEAFDGMAQSLQSRDADLQAELLRSRRLQDQQVTMLHELNHRVKNTLATVQSLARQSRGGPDEAEQLQDRILSLSKSHDLLTRDDWSGASWGEILENELGPYRTDPGRFELSGGDVALPPRHVLALGMTIHELTTNAAKYGALSVPGGRVSIAWSRDAGPDDDRLRVEWRERGGPPVATPARRGFGTRLITGGVARELDGRVELFFDPEGLRCEIDVPVGPARVQPEPGTFAPSLAPWPGLRPVA